MNILTAFSLISRTLFDVVVLIGDALDYLLKTGTGHHKLADARITIRGRYTEEEVTWANVSNTTTLTEYMQIPISYTETTTDVVNLDEITMRRAVFLTHKVVGFIQNILGEREVCFTKLDIVLVNNPLSGFYGCTEYTDDNNPHTIFLNTHEVSEVQFASTICHEFGHVLIPCSMNHNIVWLATTAFIMGLVWRHVQEYKDMRNFKFCVSATGLNIINDSESRDYFPI